ncbi:hypothetical protein Tco_0940233 [Tanacetum coccineum]|uniref:Retrovirus-related Pol polyprotein from transposon TNT 1-94 n=1 Tax=Tanacetum coccineum TaxID=301880 RepID=A0ABQ5DP45_9ASTR
MLAEALESGVVLDEEQMAFLADNGDTVTIGQEYQKIPTPAIFQTDDLDAFDSDYVLSVVPTHDTYLDNQVIDQSVQEMQYSEQPVFNNDTYIDITSESNIISYEQYLRETKNAVIQDTSSSIQQDALMSMIEVMSNYVAKCNEMDKEYKAKEDKYLKEIIGLQKKKKALDNAVYKMGQSTQTMHMLTKPQAFYDESHKTALGYQNPLYLTQTQRKVPALYCGHTIVKQHDALSIIDTEETLELAEESMLKMHAKLNDPIAKDKKVNIAPIDYAALNKLSEPFVKHFMPKKQLSAEQAFWLPISKPNSEIPPVQPEPVLKEIPRELC